MPTIKCSHTKTLCTLVYLCLNQITKYRLVFLCYVQGFLKKRRKKNTPRVRLQLVKQHITSAGNEQNYFLIAGMIVVLFGEWAVGRARGSDWERFSMNNRQNMCLCDWPPTSPILSGSPGNIFWFDSRRGRPIGDTQAAGQVRISPSCSHAELRVRDKHFPKF